MKCRSNWIQVSVEFFWTALKSHSWRPTSKASALMRNACVRALAMAKDLLEHNDARLVVYGCSGKLYTGCTVLILAILKRTANAAIPVLSLRTTQVVDFYRHRSFWKENISHCSWFNFKIHLENYAGQFETIWLWLSRWVRCFTSSSFLTSKTKRICVLLPWQVLIASPNLLLAVSVQ